MSTETTGLSALGMEIYCDQDISDMLPLDCLVIAHILDQDSRVHTAVLVTAELNSEQCLGLLASAELRIRWAINKYLDTEQA